MKKILFLIIACVVMLIPSDVIAQFFDKQKVVVWEIVDQNNDVKVADATKAQIRSSMVDAFVNSRNYEAFEVNIAEVQNRVRAKGLALTSENIVKVIKEKHAVNYVLFTTIKVVAHSNSYEDYKVLLSSDLISTVTRLNERTAYVEMKSDVNAIPGACAELLSSLLGEKIVSASDVAMPTPVANNETSVNTSHAQYQAQLQAALLQQDIKQNSRHTTTAADQGINGVYKIGDLYNRNGMTGIVIEVSADGKHGKILSLNDAKGSWDIATAGAAAMGNSWRLPTKNEFLTLCAIKGIINKSLKAAGGSKLSFLLVHWTCDVDPAIPNQAWCIDFSIGGLRTVNKNMVAAWRAVCEF